MRLPLRATRARVGIVTTAALVAATLVAASPTPAHATQAAGHDLATWAPGWSWTYGTTFVYDDGAGTNATINENVTYTNAGPVTYNGQDAYQLNLAGTITGGNGKVSGSVSATLDSFSGTVSGTEYVRRSDLALLQESQHQNLNAKAHSGIITIGVTAAFDITLSPTPGWRTLDFPLNAGDAWHNNVNVDYSGGFTYDAGSLGGSGGGPFNGSFPVNGPSTVSAATISAGGNPSLATDYVAASGDTDNGPVVDNNWWSPAFKNVAQEHLRLPLSGAVLTEDRTLTSASIAAPSTTVSETVTPSLTCAGGAVTVAGTLSSHASGVPVSVVLDESAASVGSAVTASTTTGTTGDYAVTLAAPGISDGLAKNGSRGNWGVLVSAGGATSVATLVVTPTDCSSIAYTGSPSAPTGTTATVQAHLVDLTGASTAGRVVTFSLSGGGSATGTANASGDVVAHLPVTGAPRAATLTTSYAGSGELAAASTSSGFTVAVDPTTTALAASASSVTIGDAVTFTATVTPGVGAGPTGSVQFSVGGSTFGAPVPLSGNSATSASYATTALGDLSVSATYLGDGTFGSSTSPTIGVHVHKPLLPTTTTLDASPASAVAGQDVALTAGVSTSDGGTATGTVTFVDGGTTLGTVPLAADGSAVLHTPALGVGSRSVVAQYSGDDTYNGTSSLPSSVTVAKANVDVALHSSDTTTVSGESVALTADVAAAAPGSGTPTGTVQLLVDGNATGAPVALSGGVATFPALTTLMKGDHALAVQYAGDGSFNAGSDSFTQHVAKADTTTVVLATPSPSAEDQAVVITAHVGAVAPGAGSPTGTVSFTSDGDPIGAGTLAPADSGGSDAVLTVSDLAPGSHTIVATYAGDSDYSGSLSQGLSQTVIAGAARVATTTTLASSANPATFGQLISFTATVAAADGSIPQGQVQFSVDGANIGDPVAVGADGTAESVTLAAPEPGDHTVIAAFTPAAAFAASGDIITQTVADADVAVHLSSSAQHSTYGHSLQFTATVTSLQTGTGTPTGYVQFGIDGSPYGPAVALDHGSAATGMIPNGLTPGAHTITALYSGDADFLSESDTLTQVVDKIGTTTALTATPAAITYGGSVNLHASVTPATTAFGTPTGTVSFVDGTTTLATVPLTASGADATISGLAAGTHAIKAVYSGAPVFAGSSSGSTSVSVAKRATTLTGQAAVVSLLPLGLPLGLLKVTLTSAAGPVAGAPITFTIGGSTVCTSLTDSSGVATCAASSQLVQLILNNGYKAAYAGSANDLGATTQAGIIK